MKVGRMYPSVLKLQGIFSVFFCLEMPSHLPIGNENMTPIAVLQDLVLSVTFI